MKTGAEPTWGGVYTLDCWQVNVKAHVSKQWTGHVLQKLCQNPNNRVEEAWGNEGYKSVLQGSVRAGPVSIATNARFKGIILGRFREFRHRHAIEAHCILHYVAFKFGLLQQRRGLILKKIGSRITNVVCAPLPRSVSQSGRNMECSRCLFQFKKKGNKKKNGNIWWFRVVEMCTPFCVTKY